MRAKNVYKNKIKKREEREKEMMAWLVSKNRSHTREKKWREVGHYVHALYVWALLSEHEYSA